MKKRIAICYLMLFSIVVGAEKMQTSSVQQINAEIKFGDKVTNYKIWKDEKTYNFSFHNSLGEAVTGNLAEKDYNFLLEKIAMTKTLSSNERRYCPTKYIKLMLDSKVETEKFACISSKTKISVRLAEVANILKLIK